MSDRVFLDTNILIYAFAANDPRAGPAEALLQQGGAVSVQVLNEFVNVSRGKLGRKWTEVEQQLEVLRALLDKPIPLTLDIHEAAVGIARESGVAFYDALIIAAAAHARCDVLYTEDMQDGQSIAGVTIHNPFHEKRS